MNTWDKTYISKEKFWGDSPDYRLLQYMSLFNTGAILDLGIGEGRNSFPFLHNGFKVHGVDISDVAISRCKDIFIDFSKSMSFETIDLRKLNICTSEYSGIIAANILNFFKKSDAQAIINKMKNGLSENGIIYISTFSILEPQFSEYRDTLDQVEENTFYIKSRDSYINYFTKDELTNYFKDYEVIFCFEGIELDISHGEPHYHGCIDMMVRKTGKAVI